MWQSSRRVVSTLNTGSTPCLVCPAGAICTGGDAFSSRVLEAVWEREGGAMVLRSCPARSYLANATRELQQCVMCPDGTEVRGGECVCSSGWGRDTGGGACVQCAPGTYKSAPGSTECSPCPSGSTTSAERATSKTECSCKAANSAMDDAAMACACKPGFEGDAAAAGGGAAEGRCTACAVGWFKSELSNRQCVPCPAGPGGVLQDTARDEGATNASAACKPMRIKLTQAPSQRLRRSGVDPSGSSPAVEVVDAIGAPVASVAGVAVQLEVGPGGLCSPMNILAEPSFLEQKIHP